MDVKWGKCHSCKNLRDTVRKSSSSIILILIIIIIIIIVVQMISLAWPRNASPSLNNLLFWNVAEVAESDVSIYSRNTVEVIEGGPSSPFVGR